MITITLTDEEMDSLGCMIENEINSDLDMTTMTKGKDKEYWREEVLFLKNLKSKLMVEEINLYAV